MDLLAVYIGKTVYRTFRITIIWVSIARFFIHARKKVNERNDLIQLREH
jgi:hypothetical protein